VLVLTPLRTAFLLPITMGALAYSFDLERLGATLQDVIAVCDKIPAGGLALLFELFDRRLDGFCLR
jgi:hypothetical protein